MCAGRDGDVTSLNTGQDFTVKKGTGCIQRPDQLLLCQTNSQNIFLPFSSKGNITAEYGGFIKQLKVDLFKLAFVLPDAACKSRRVHNYLYVFNQIIVNHIHTSTRGS